jgi:hypothetical protein
LPASWLGEHLTQVHGLEPLSTNTVPDWNYGRRYRCRWGVDCSGALRVSFDCPTGGLIAGQLRVQMETPARGFDTPEAAATIRQRELGSLSSRRRSIHRLGQWRMELWRMR